MGSLLSCCCCCNKHTETHIRRSSSLSGLETIRPQNLSLQICDHTKVSNPFIDMNPVLIETTASISTHEVFGTVKTGTITYLIKKQ